MADREFVAVTGPSGCGKSTLLNLLGGLDHPDSGEIHVGDFALHSANEAALTHYRRHHLGIVFQFFNLLPTMTIVENVELPLLFQGAPRRTMRSRADELLGLVGIAHRAAHFPHQLSGGELQRAAIARALVHRPTLLLADEPTGNLDTANAHRVLEALANIASQNLATMVVVTHSEEVANLAPRRICLLDGKITHA
ncbi:MAG: ABC transporter ATP-binding protein [Chthoniobacterales bacterium]